MRTLHGLWIAAALAACGGRRTVSGADSITVFAAASLAPAVEQLARSRPAGLPTVRVSAASSSTLARQIERGAGADLFLSAHPEWIERLLARGLLVPDSIRDVASNELVWVVPAGGADATPLELDPAADLGGSFRGRLALGDPAYVPLGRYARKALEALGAWGDLEPRVAPALDARAALRLVELGEAGAGIVYGSDAASSDRVVVRAHFPRELSGPIRYRGAVVRGAGEGARAFLDELAGPDGAATLESFGFLPTTP